VLGRLALLPALHNFTLWRIVHNRMHHFELCVQGVNSWSPLSKEEFDRLPGWRRAMERLYRSPLGLGPYYFCERWLKDKFLPSARMRDTRPIQQWLDFAGILVFLGMLGVIFWFAAEALEHLSYGEAWLWGFVVPFLVWNYLMGFTVYVQHTHPLVPWFRTKHDED
jgi:omega-6 fatty acid desaturase (delta-12 desaturase)